MAKLNLDRDKVDTCRELAEGLVRPIQKYIEMHSTVAIERATLRLFGLTGASSDGPTPTPLTNLFVDKIDRYKLSLGAATWVAAAKIKNPKISFSEMATKVAEGSLDINS